MASEQDVMPAEMRLGCMGWQEKDWRGPLYPESMKPADMLAAYAAVFSTVEVDSTFYGRPRETTVEQWRAAVPEGFRFALKVPREITHRRRFKDAHDVFALFMQRVQTLGSKLGAVLIQCPRDFKPTPANRAQLFAFLENELSGEVNVALELRHESWFDEALFAATRNAGCAVVAAESEFSSIDLAERVLRAQAGEPGFAYIRWMGLEAMERYDRVQLDKGAALAQWARIIGDVRPRFKAIYGFVSDDYEGHAPATVRSLSQLLGEPVAAGPRNPTLF